MGRLFDFILDIPERISSAIKERRMISIYKKTIRKASYAGSPFIRYYLERGTTLFIMGCLQLISFFTTYAGAKYYFGNVVWFAPAAFTLGIQVAFFVYSKRFTQTESRKKQNVVLMSLFCLISAIFSYTGLVVATLPPEAEYEKTYKEYVSAAESVYNQLIGKNSTEQEINIDAQNLLTKAQTLIQNAETQSDSLNEQITQNENTFGEDKTYTSYYDEFGNFVTISGTGSAGSAAAAALPDLKQRQGLIDGECENLDTVYKQLGADDIIGYIHAAEEDLMQYSETAANITNLITCYNELSTTLGNEEQISDTYVEELRNKYINYKNLQNVNADLLELESVQTNDEISFDSIIEWFVDWVTAKNSAEQAIETLNEKKNIVDENYLNLSNLAKELGAEDIDFSDLKDARHNLNSYGDPNLQAVLYLIDGEYWNKVIGILILALLVDGLTYLLGLIGSQRPLAMLDSKTNREIDNEDHLFSIIFVSLLNKEMPEVLQGKDTRVFKQLCIQYVNDIKNIIHDFLNKFHNSPWTNQWGYGLYAKYEELKDIEGVVPIVSILQQLGYLQFLSPKEFKLLKENYHGIEMSKGTNHDNRVCELDDYICILRYRVELYLRNSTAEIVMNVSTIDSDEEGSEEE